MFKRSVFYALSFICVAFLASCVLQEQQEQPSSPVIRVESWQPKAAHPGSVVVCRQKQCAPADLSMSSEYIYNSLAQLLDNNNQSTLLPCTADASTHVCTEEYVALPITVGVTPAFMYINSVKVSDISIALNRKTLDLILNYNVTYNGQTPVCKPAKSLIYVKNAKNIIMEDSGYACKMTTIGSSIVKTLFAIDYIDLDYGYIGGYYSIGVSGPAFGGGSGYMMLRLPKDAYPLSPELTYKKEDQAQPLDQGEPFGQSEEFVEEESPTSPSKIKVTVKTTTKGKSGKEENCLENAEEIQATETNPDTLVRVEYTDPNGVKIFPLVRPRVKVSQSTTPAEVEKPKIEVIDEPSTANEENVEEKIEETVTTESEEPVKSEPEETAKTSQDLTLEETFSK